MGEWTPQPVVEPVFIGIITAALVAMLLIKPAFSGATSQRRWILSGLRLVGVLLLVIAMLRPGCTRTIEKQQSAVLLLMCDLSRSMQLPHRSQDESRYELMQEILAKNAGKLKELNDRNVLVKSVGFDGVTYSLDFNEGEIRLPDEPDGGTTDIGTTLGETLEKLRSQRLVGAIVMSDGVQNEASPRIELGQAVDELVQLQTPLYSVPFGQEAIAGQFSDIAVENMSDQFSVFVKNRLVIKATLRVRGFVNQKVPVRLILQNSKGEKETVYTDMVEVTQDGMQKTLTMPFVPKEAGQFKIILQADEQPEELVTRNNRLPAFLTVYEGGLRVLYLYGSLTAEQRYLKASIGASPDVQFDFVSINPRNRSSWPLKRNDWFDHKKYDVFIFSDVDSRAFYDEESETSNFEALTRAIEQGSGFLMIGGRQSFGPGMYHSTPLAEILPVQMDKFERQDFDRPTTRAYHLEGDLKLSPTDEHFLTSFTDDMGNPIWSILPPLPGANRLKAKPTSRVLLRTQNGAPMMIADNAGGRVLGLAVDSTWLWFTHDQQDFHRRFWRQVVLWLAGRDGQEEGNVWINLSQRRFLQGVPVGFVIGARDSIGVPIQNAKYELSLRAPDGSSQPILATSKTGSINGQVDQKYLVQPGTYQLELAVRKGNSKIGSTAAEFIVFDHDKEKSNPVADPRLLDRIARRTAEYGGMTVAPVEFGELLDDILQQPMELKIKVPETWKLGDTVFEGLLFVFGLVGVLSFEWFLRKKWGMV